MIVRVATEMEVTLAVRDTGAIPVSTRSVGVVVVVDDINATESESIS